MVVGRALDRFSSGVFWDDCGLTVEIAMGLMLFKYFKR